MTRTYEQMHDAAFAQRRKMLDEARDPLVGVFDVTPYEHLMILDHPPYMRHELSTARDRICGLRIRIVDPDRLSDEV